MSSISKTMKRTSLFVKVRSRLAFKVWTMTMAAIVPWKEILRA